MKIQKKELKKLISALNEIHNGLKSDDDFHEFSGKDFSEIKEFDNKIPICWAIRADNKENAEILFPWINFHFNHAWKSDNKEYYKRIICFKRFEYQNNDTSIPIGYDLITMDQFKDKILPVFEI